MLKCIAAIILTTALFTSICSGEVADSLVKQGDIVFQDLPTSQGMAVKLATKSEYTHCGLVLKDSLRGWIVLEAVHPVRVTELREWIARGAGSKFEVRRLKDHAGSLPDSVWSNVRKVGDTLCGKPYDIFFGWSDDKWYCSELVWKMYDRIAHIKLCPTRPLRSFDLSSPAVRQKLSERYGANVPLDEPVVAPSDLLVSDKLSPVIYTGR